MRCVLAVGATLLLAACVPAPVRPVQPDADIAGKSEAQRQALERERLAREQAELRRKEAEARQPVPGTISTRPSIAAHALEPIPAPSVEERPAPAAEPAPAPATQPLPAPKPTPAPKAEPSKLVKAAPKSDPAKVDYATMAWQLSTDLRSLQSVPDVETFYNDRGWVVSVPAEALFDRGGTSIKAGEGATLDSLARVLRHYAARGIVMDGPEAERAQAIRRALSERGIPEQAITANGVGERVEFVVPFAGLNAGAGN